jgi:hypothetical protein
MKTRFLRSLVSSILLLGLATSGAAIAGDAGKGCQIQGTWFGVNNLDDKLLAGWVVTATGKSANHGVNVFEFPTYDLTFGGTYSVVDGSANRGVWKRINGNTFEYSFMTILVDEERAPVYYLRVSGQSTLSADCMSETITAVMDFYLPNMSPFEDPPAMSVTLDPHYGYRFTLD